MEQGTADRGLMHACAERPVPRRRDEAAAA